MKTQTTKTKFKNRIFNVTHAALAAMMLWNSSCAGGEQAVIDALTAQSGLQSPDFGDAPDRLDARYNNGMIASFPTRLSANGAHHADATRIALGLVDANGDWPSTIEMDATDTVDSDGVQNIEEVPDDSDRDNKDDGLLTFVFGDDEEQNLKFSVTASDDAMAGTYYLNVLFDWNKDGEWKGEDSNGAKEWAVVNQEVTLAPGDAFVDVTESFLTGVDAHPVWVRLTLSETPVNPQDYPEGWDGTGAFTLGETEDYLLNNVQVINVEKDLIRLPGVPPGPFYPPVGGGGKGGGDAPCEYEIFQSMTLCKDRSTTRLVTIGGFAPDDVSVTSDDPSVASVSLNEANITVTGNSTGRTTIHIIAVQAGCTYYLTLSVEVKDCPKAKKAMIDCCSAEQIRRDPALCKNCRIVGRQHNQSNTFGGGGEIPETDMEGVKTNVSKSYVIGRPGGLIDVVTVYYECDPCEDPSGFFTEIEEAFFSQLDQALFGGENGIIDNWEEYEELQSFYDGFFDDASYECADRYFRELFESLESGGLE